MFELFAKYVNTKRIKRVSDQEVDDNHPKHRSYSKGLASETKRSTIFSKSIIVPSLLTTTVCTYTEPPQCMFACVKEGKDLGTS